MNKLKNRFIAGFFTILVGVGIFCYSDFGIWIDEPVERYSGVVSLNAIGQRFDVDWIKKDAVLSNPRYSELGSLNDYRDRDYPVLFSMTAVFLERIFNIVDDQKIYFFRHLLNYLVVLFGLFAIYQISARRFASWQWGLITALLFILTPRMFAESYYNSKDLIFLSFFAIATNTLVQFVIRPSFKTALWHALFTALAIDIRVMGVILLVLTLGITIVRVARKEIECKKALSALALYLLVTPLLVILFWPWLWTHPIEHFIQAFANMAHFRLDMPIAFLGQMVQSTKLPWHYIPVWILVTTPILFIVLFVYGLFNIFKTVFLNKTSLWTTEKQLQDLIFLALFVLPIVAVIVLHSVLYNGWRQLYFIYPAFLLIATYGMVTLWGSALKIRVSSSEPLQSLSLGQWILASFLGCSLLWNAVWIVRAHPFANVYFNILAGSAWESNFEADFGGLSGRKALEWILAQDSAPIVRIHGVWHTFFVDPNLRSRILLVRSPEEADYAVNSGGEKFTKAHEIKVDDRPIASIYKKIIPKPLAVAPQLNQSIEFGSTGTGLQYLLGVGEQAFTGVGWSNPESWGVWSDGSSARVFLPLPVEKGNQLVLQARAFVVPGHLGQTVRVKVNGKLGANVVLAQPEGNQIAIALTSEMLSKNYLFLEFEFPDATSPKALNLGSDQRKLALGLEKIVLN